MSKLLRGIYVCNHRISGYDYYDTLEDLQEAVNGHIEYIQLNKELYMIVDEEGKIKDKPFNKPATTILQSFGIDDCIVGSALIVKSKNHRNVNVLYKDFTDICRRAGA